MNLKQRSCFYPSIVPIPMICVLFFPNSKSLASSSERELTNKCRVLPLCELLYFFANNPKYLDLSYKTDLDLWDCLVRKGKTCIIAKFHRTDFNYL